MQLVVAKVIFGVCEDLASCLQLREGGVHVTRDDRGIVDEVQEPTSMFSQNDLLLSTLNRGGKVVVIGLLKLLAGLEGLEKSV